MSRFDRDLKLLSAGNLLFALGVGMYLQLLFVYALDLGASRFTIGLLNAIMMACIAAGNIPGAWASHRFRLKTVIVAVWWLTVPTAVCFALAPSWPWLIPGLVLSGLYMANNPAFKTYIALKSEAERMARNLTLVFGSYPAGLVVAPLMGGYIADHYGMRTVFWVSAVFFVASSLTATLIGDVPYHASETPLKPAAVGRNRSFRRYVAFFLVGFLAVYVGQPFLTPYLAVVHDQGYSALGVYASLAALGAALLTPLSGRIADLRGPRAGAALVLVLVSLGTLLLLLGVSPLVWAAAMFLCGGYDTFRFLATGVVGRSFGDIPLAWGFALFDTTMGLPMAGGALLGGALFQASSSLPFLFTIAVSVILLVALAIAPRTAAYDWARTGTRYVLGAVILSAPSGRERRETTDPGGDMGVFDTIKDKAGDLAGDAERAGKIGAAQVKLKSLQGDVKDAMEALGREAFELIEKGEFTNPGLDAVIAKVRETNKAVADKKAEIEKLRAED